MISICIPAYEMDGEGAKFLCQSLEAIQAQSFKDHETVVSDHTLGAELDDLCARFDKVRHVRFQAKRGNSSANLNNAINHARGDHIKILFQDDFLAGPDALARMAGEIGEKAWLVHGYWHTDYSGGSRLRPTAPAIPGQFHDIRFANTIGAPTAIMFRRCDMRFDENLLWYMDCDFYFRMLCKFGAPQVVAEPLAVQTLWAGQLTNKLAESVKTWERNYITKKHAVPVDYHMPA